MKLSQMLDRPLVVFLILFFPIYFCLRWLLPGLEAWLESGVLSPLSPVAVLATFGIVVVIFRVKDKVRRKQDRSALAHGG